MLGYTYKDVEDMKYGIASARLLINADENPAIDRYLMEAHSLLDGLIVEGYIEGEDDN